MDLNLSKLSDKEIAMVCIKYDIIRRDELRNHSRNEVLTKINCWCKEKQTKYKSRPRSNSSPNIKSVTVDKSQSTKNLKPVLQRTMSSPSNMNVKNIGGPPKANIHNRNRRMSEPLTPSEKDIAKEDHQMKKQYHL